MLIKLELLSIGSYFAEAPHGAQPLTAKMTIYICTEKGKKGLT
jgi:hypothetical protein